MGADPASILKASMEDLSLMWATKGSQWTSMKKWFVWFVPKVTTVCSMLGTPDLVLDIKVLIELNSTQIQFFIHRLLQ